MGARLHCAVAAPGRLPCRPQGHAPARAAEGIEATVAEEARSRDAALATDELEGVVHQELDGLPERYRFPLLLCDLEGRTYEEAARHLGCPVGTVKSRLARARQRLRGRLERRGLAPAMIGPGAAIDFSARTPVPPALVEQALDAAMNAAACPVVSSLALATMKSMLVAKLKTAAAIVLAAAVLMAGIAIGGGRAVGQAPVAKAAQNPPQRSELKNEAPAAQAAHFSWQRADRYDPPDFERFFPRDSLDAGDLTSLWETGELQKKPRDEIMKLMRASLRGTTGNRDEILNWFGDKYIWSAAPQDPEAIEIMYHACDYRGPCVQGMESPPVYSGLSVVAPKPPAVLHALVDLCMHTPFSQDWGRVAWGARTQRAELLAFLKPYLAAEDQSTREKAVVLEKVLGDLPDHVAALTEWLAKQVRIKSGNRLPAVRQALLSGTSQDRIEALRVVLEEDLCRIIDESFVDAFRNSAADADMEVRRQAARTIGVCARIDFAGPKTDLVFDILLRLAEDKDPEVRYNAVWQGLIPIPERSVR